MNSTWLGHRRRGWLGPVRPAAKVEKPEPPRAAQVTPPKVEPEPYAVPFLPVRCPRCDRGDCVRTYTTRTDKSPPTRYHQCSRCGGLKFRSFEVEEGSDGKLLLRRSN